MSRRYGTDASLISRLFTICSSVVLWKALLIFVLVWEERDLVSLLV